MKPWMLPPLILAGLLWVSLAHPVVTAHAAANTPIAAAAIPITASPTLTGTATETPTTPAAAPDSGENDEIAQLAAANPPPRLSARELGITEVPCDVAALRGEDEVEGKTFYCGIFTVPQNWEEPDGRNLDLFFMVAKATGDNPEPDPLVFLAGGPGQSSVLAGLSSYDKVRPARDIVRMDQRGTGLSQRLDVPECLVAALSSNMAEENLATVLEVLAAADTTDENGPAPDAVETSLDMQAKVNQLCWEQFKSDGLDLNQFTTAAAARDLVELLKALGYKSYNLHGISYGTRLAMTIMRGVPGVEAAPELRAVVLDSTNPPSVNVLADITRNTHDQVLQLLEDCEQDEVCRNAYPNLKQRLHNLFARLEAEPLVVDGQTVTAHDVAAQLTRLTGTRAGYMPRMIAELEQGVLDTYTALAQKKVGIDSPEGVSGLDRSDPVQAFIADGMAIVAKTGGMDAIFAFVVNVGGEIGKDDPIAALQAAITANYEGDMQQQLLQGLAKLTAQDFAASPYVSQARQQASAAKTETAEESAVQQQRTARMLAATSLASFLNHNIHCNDSFQRVRYEDAVNTYHDLEFPELASLQTAKDLTRECENWPVAAAPVAISDPVSSTVPALILQAAYDESTPVYSGRRAARELQNSTFVLVPQEGHEVWKQSTNCVGQIATAFVLDPTQKVDLSCLDARRPQWSLPTSDLTPAP